MSFLETVKIISIFLCVLKNRQGNAIYPDSLCNNRFETVREFLVFSSECSEGSSVGWVCLLAGVVLWVGMKIWLWDVGWTDLPNLDEDFGPLLACRSISCCLLPLQSNEP